LTWFACSYFLIYSFYPHVSWSCSIYKFFVWFPSATRATTQTKYEWN
jgi:hypothetical protein